MGKAGGLGGVKSLLTAAVYASLATPLLVWQGFFFPHLTTKVLAFQLCVDAGVLSAAWLQLRSMPTAPGETARGLPATPLTFTLALYLAYCAVSSFAGADAHRSWWGIIDRQDGLVLLWHFLAWYLLLQQFGRSGPPHAGDAGPRRARVPQTARGAIGRLLVFSYWISVGVAASVLAEWLAFAMGTPPPPVLRSMVPGRYAGVFGNPTLLGPYLSAHFFLGLSLLLRGGLGLQNRLDRRRDGKKRPAMAMAAGACEIVLLAAILLGQTRGVIAGLLVGLLVGATLLIITGTVRRAVRTGALLLVLAMMLGALGIWLLRGSAIARSLPLLDRITFSESTSVGMRMLTWRSAWQSFKDHPLFGSGHNNVYYGLNRHYDPTHVRYTPDFAESWLTWYDKSHNGLLDLLDEKGLSGALLYAGILATALLALRRVEDRTLAALLAAALVSVLVAGAFAFDSFGSYFALFLVLAALNTAAEGNSLGRLFPRVSARASTLAAPLARVLPAWRRPALVALGVAAAGGIYLNASMAMANARCRQAQLTFSSDAAEGLRRYEDAFECYSPYNARQRLHCAVLAIEAILNRRLPDGGGAHLRRALDMAQEASAAFPLDVEVQMTLADIHNNLGMYVDPSYLEKAESHGLRAHELSPHRQEAAFYLGRTYVLRKEASRAVELNRRMVADAPDFAIARWFLMLSLVADGQRDEAKEALRKAFELGYRFRSPDEESVARDLLGASEFEAFRKAYSK